MGAEKWRYVKWQLKRRNVDTEVYIDGALCPPEIVLKGIQRQGFETVFDRLSRGVNYITITATQQTNN
jgi:hypothetical protein